MSTYVSIDIGTTNIKAMAVTATQHWSEATLATPWSLRQGHRVLNPDRLLKGTIDVVRHVLDQSEPIGGRVDALAITSMGEVGLFVGSQGPLGEIGAWQDVSSTEEAYRNLLGTWDAEALYERTGIVPGPKFGIFRMRGESHRSAGGAVWLSVADFIAWYLTGGTFATHASLAARTMAYAWQVEDWDDGLLGWAGLDRTHMPPITFGSDNLGPVRVTVEPRLAGAAVVNAGHDHVVGAYGAELAIGELMDSTGTAEPLVIRSSQPVLTREARSLGLFWSRGLFERDNHVALLPTPGGGAPETWARRVLGLSWSDLQQVGANRTTDVSFNVEEWMRGNASWHGLGYTRDRMDLYWAVLVAVAETLAKRIGDMEHLMQLRYPEVKVVGGIVNHALWLDVRAKAINRDQLLMHPANAALVGAAEAAAHSIGERLAVVPTWDRVPLAAVRET